MLIRIVNKETAVTPSETRTGAQLVLDALLHAGVEQVFGYPGGAIMPLYDALVESPIQHVLTRHEQMAIHAADGYARATGRIGVCMATSGPGATNLVTGICTAMMDSSPVLCLTAQVNTPTLGTDAFQEADVLGIVSTVTKQAFLVRALSELPEVLAEALYLVQSGRPGPVVVDLPKNVLSGSTVGHFAPVESIPGYAPTPALDPDSIRAAHRLLRNAERPVCIVGGGAKISGAVDDFRAWSAAVGIPVAVTLNGIGTPAPDDPALLGMLGMHGRRCANRAVHDADLIIGMGMRFDDRVTGKLDVFARDADVVHIDVDVAEIGKIVPVTVGVHADLTTALRAWQEEVKADPLPDFRRWRATCQAAGTGLQVPDRLADAPPSMIEVIDALAARISPDTIVATDVGQHQMWVAQRVAPNHPRCFITSGGAGTMGFGLPSAIGAQFGCPTHRVVAVVGDGGFQMSQAELATVRRCDLPVKILVLDNKYLGMVRQWQQMFFEERYSGVDLSDNPSFFALARVYGLPAYHVDRAKDLDEQLLEWLECRGPALLHCECRVDENVFPMVPANTALGDMLEAS